MRDTQTVPAPEAFFGFESALKWLKAGQKLTRRAWCGAQLQLVDGDLEMHLKMGHGTKIVRGSTLGADSLIATDWEVVR
jgi:hypothetical protein